ncbi:MAG: TolC family protein [Candidatus Cloacimonetes bacterium]|nr:TolC family protein [Candidatus Cloacimonadota bacterium]
MKIYKFLIPFLLICPILVAQNIDLGSIRSISLEEARQKALAQNSSYKAQESSLEAARWSKTAAQSSFLPSLNLGASYLWMDPATTIQSGSQSIKLNNDFRTISLTLSQPLYTGGKLWQAYKIARSNEDIQKLSLESKRYSLISEVESKYLAILRLKSLYEISQQELSTASDNLEIALLKMQTGLIARAEYLRFQANVANKEVALLAAQTSLQLALQDFANYLNEPDLLLPRELDIEAEEVLIQKLRLLDLDQTQALIGKALVQTQDRNLNLKVLSKTQDLSERAYKIAKAAFLPTLILSGSRNYEENGIDRYDFSASNQIMLNASLPILPFLGNYANLKKAKSDVQRTRLEARSVSDGIRLGTQSAVTNWVNAAKQIKSSELALEYSLEMYQQMKERYNQNLLSSIELLDAELMLSAARLNATNARHAYFQSRTALMQILALEDPRTLESILN